MATTAGIILDVYDDDKGLVLHKLASSGKVSEKLAAATLMDAAELAELPDRLFALVGTNHGVPFRKYAMHDPKHLASSVLYFMEQGHLLPDAVRQKVAANLVNGFADYESEPPEELAKIALGPVGALTAGLGAVDAAGRAKREIGRHQSDMERFREAQVSGTKTSDLVGTNIMPKSGVTRSADHVPGTSQLARPKVAEGWVHCGELSQYPAPTVKRAAAQHFALAATKQYPIDTPDLVKRASAYFDEHRLSFTPADRRAFAQAVVERADELKVKISGGVFDYAGNEYGPFIESELISRRNNFEGMPEAAAYQLMLDKVASVTPDVMAQMIETADGVTGIDDSYDRPGTGFLDPYRAVYGGIKLSHLDQPYAWSQGRDKVSGAELEKLANHALDKLASIFGMPFAESFRRDPVGIFESMPDPQKVVLSRLATQ